MTAADWFALGVSGLIMCLILVVIDVRDELRRIAKWLEKH